MNLSINISDIMSELAAHAHAQEDAGQAMVQAASKRDAAKERLNLTDAAIMAELTAANEKMAVEKLKAQALQDPRHADAWESFHAADLAAEQAAITYEAMKQRGSMLKAIVQLLAVGYGKE
jgi:cell pole-organizing protein PopZ